MPISTATRNRRAHLMKKLPRKDNITAVGDEAAKSTRELADDIGLTTRQAGRLLGAMEREYPAVHSKLCRIGARSIRLWWQNTHTSGASDG